MSCVELGCSSLSCRYQRGSRSLLQNLKKSSGEASASTEGDNMAKVDEDEGYDVPEEIENIFDGLLGSLADSDTIVRCSHVFDLLSV